YAHAAAPLRPEHPGVRASGITARGIRADRTPVVVVLGDTSHPPPGAVAPGPRKNAASRQPVRQPLRQLLRSPGSPRRPSTPPLQSSPNPISPVGPVADTTTVRLVRVLRLSIRRIGASSGSASQTLTGPPHVFGRGV